MRTLEDLITHHEAREVDCARERDRSHELKREADAKRAFKVWEEQRQVARDTASWLKTIARRSA